MNPKLKFLAPLVIVGIVILFIYNIYSHGTIVNPGEAEYKVQCAQCHGDNGEGIKTLIPPLNHSDFAAKNFDSIPCWLKNGMNHAITVKDTVYDQPMYPNKNLDEVRAANVINYMSKEFWGLDRQVNSGWVAQKWKECR